MMLDRPNLEVDYYNNFVVNVQTGLRRADEVQLRKRGRCSDDGVVRNGCQSRA